VSFRAEEKIWSRYKQGELKALRAKKRGPRHNTSSLFSEQVKQLKGCIRKGTPDSYHVPYFLWTANAVRLLINKSEAQSPKAAGGDIVAG
jgi:hypothetical protein